METYHKINAPYKRHLEGRLKGKLIEGDWSVPEFEYLAKNKWEFTEKVDGTNIRIQHEYNALTGHEDFEVTFGGRTYRSEIPEHLMTYLQDTFTVDLFHNAGFTDDHPVILYGEGYGPKIQDGKGYGPDHKFVLFDVKINGFWLDRDNVNDVAQKLGIESVPVIGRGTLADAVDIVTLGLGPGVDGRTKSFTGSLKRGLQSAWGPFEAEGIVARPVLPLFDRKGQRIITKIKAVDFK